MSKRCYHGHAPKAQGGEQMRGIPKAALGRLPAYLEYVKALPADAPDTISAAAIARALGLGEVQVRKDLSTVSGAGKPRVGYQMRELTCALCEALGHGSALTAVIVGGGKLGSALIGYDGFEGYGVHIAAAFDIKVTEETILPGGKRLLPAAMLPEYVKKHPAAIGIITVPASSAQAACDLLVAAHVKAIWNFAPCRVHAPKGVAVAHEDLALSLAALAAQIR